MITIGSYVLSNWQSPKTSVQLRITALTEFITVDGKTIQAGNPDSGPVYQTITCTPDLTAKTLTIPAFKIDTTIDSLTNQDARYAAFFYSGKERIGVFQGFERFIVPPSLSAIVTCTPLAGTTICYDWGALRIYNAAFIPVADDVTYNKTQINALLLAISRVVPGGLDQQIQFNAAGAFGGDSRLLWNNASKLLTNTGLTQLGSGTNINEGSQFGLGATAGSLQTALGSQAVPVTSTTPNVVLQKFLRNTSGINLQTGTYIDQLNNANNDHFDIASFVSFTPDLLAVSGRVINETSIRGYITLAPTNIGDGVRTNLVNAYTFISTVSRTTTTGDQARGVAYYGEVLNNTVDAAGSFGTQNAMGVFLGHAGGTKLNTALLVSEATSYLSAFRTLISVGPNSVAGIGLDFFPMSTTVGGIWASNGTTTITGTGGRATVDVLVGDHLLFNGTFYQVASTPSSDNSIILTATVGAASGQTMTKRTVPFRLANESPIQAVGNDDSSTYNVLVLTRQNDVRMFTPGLFRLGSADGTLNYLTLGNGSAAINGYFEIPVSAAPAAPAAGGRLSCDVSGGKTRLLIRFPTGASQQIAIEP